jgi:hypothetical protein
MAGIVGCPGSRFYFQQMKPVRVRRLDEFYRPAVFGSQLFRYFTQEINSEI